MPTPDQLHEINLKRLEHEYESERQRVEFVQQFAHGGLKLIVLLNGGALVALFTLLGNLDQTAVAALALNERSLHLAFVWFVAGLVSACVAHLLAYACQEFLTAFFSMSAGFTYVSLRDGKDQDRAPANRMGEIGNRFIVAAIVFVLLSIGSFATGAYFALDSSEPSRSAINEVGPAAPVQDDGKAI